MNLNRTRDTDRAFSMNDEGLFIFEARRRWDHEVGIFRREVGRTRKEMNQGLEEVRKGLQALKKERRRSRKKVKRMQRENEIKFELLFTLVYQLRADMNQLRADTERQKEQTYTRREISESYLQHRCRVLDDFCKRSGEKYHQQTIANGKSIAHNANCTADAFV